MLVEDLIERLADAERSALMAELPGMPAFRRTGALANFVDAGHDEPPMVLEVETAGYLAECTIARLDRYSRRTGQGRWTCLRTTDAPNFYSTSAPVSLAFAGSLRSTLTVS